MLIGEAAGARAHSTHRLSLTRDATHTTVHETNKGNRLYAPAAQGNAAPRVKAVARVKPPNHQNIPRLPAQNDTSRDDASGNSHGSRTGRGAYRRVGGTWRGVRSVGSQS